MKYLRRIKWWLTSSWYRKHGWLPHWSLDHYILMNTLPHLKLLKENPIGYPCVFDDVTEWQEVLGTIIEGFEYYLEDDWFHEAPEKRAKYEEAKELFFDYFEDLWD